MEKITNCNQCFNFCPIESVKCNKEEALRDRLEKEKINTTIQANNQK